MLDAEHARDIDGRTRRPVTPREEDRGNDRRRLQVAAVEKLHLTVDDRTLCGFVTVDELDAYQDEAGLRAWNDGPLEQCAQRQAALLAPIRPSTRADVRATDRRAGHGDHPEPAQPDQPIPGQRA
jgi:hypothetical protein